MKHHLSDTTQTEIVKLDERPAPVPNLAYVASDPMLAPFLDRLLRNEETSR